MPFIRYTPEERKLLRTTRKRARARGTVVKPFTWRRMVYNGLLSKTPTGLTKNDLTKNKRGRIVSKRKSEQMLNRIAKNKVYLIHKNDSSLNNNERVQEMKQGWQELKVNRSSSQKKRSSRVPSPVNRRGKRTKRAMVIAAPTMMTRGQRRQTTEAQRMMPRRTRSGKFM